MIVDQHTMGEQSETAETRDKLLSRMYEMDIEPFKHLCKIVLNEVESPSQIEVAHDRSYGPHIHGQVGEELLTAVFGVQVFQHSLAVPEAAINEIRGQFEDTGCQFGTLITLSEFTSDATDRAEELEGISVRLVDGSELSSVMIHEGLGVNNLDNGYEIDEGFWEQFEKFNTDLIPSRKVPQADSLKLIAPTLRSIYNDHRNPSEMAEYLRKNSSDHITERQARYYVTAAELLDLAKPILDPHGQSTVHGWELTDDGKEYMSKSDGRDEFVDSEYLQDRVENLDIVRQIKKEFEKKTKLDHNDLVKVIESETTVTGSTAERRATCLGKWFWTIQGDIRRPNRSKREYEYYPGGGIDSYFSS